MPALANDRCHAGLQALAHIIAEAVDAILSYCHLCLYDDGLRGLAPVLEEAGCGLINASPLAMGLLSGSPAPPWHPAPEALRRACAELGDWCADRGEELAALALGFALEEAAPASTLVGMGSREELAGNLAVLASPPAPERVAEARERLRGVWGMGWPSPPSELVE